MMRPINILLLPVLSALSLEMMHAETSDELLDRKTREAQVIQKVKEFAASIGSQREQTKELMDSATGEKPLTDEDIEAMVEDDYQLWRDKQGQVLESIRRTRSVAGRARDPFGFSTKATIGPVEQQAGVDSTAGKSTSQHAAIPQQEITAGMAVDTLPVVGVSAQRREFFVGARTVRQGDTVTLSYAGRTFLLKVISVESSEIVFEESDGRKAVKALAIVPPTSHPLLQPLTR